jgi:hypothetical protein
LAGAWPLTSITTCVSDVSTMMMTTTSIMHKKTHYWPLQFILWIMGDTLQWGGWNVMMAGPRARAKV